MRRVDHDAKKLNRRSRWACGWIVAVVVQATFVFPGMAPASAAGDDPAGRSAPTRTKSAALAPAAVLDERMMLLTRELNLDVQQQAAVRKLLLNQREQAIALWNGSAVPPAYRIGAMQAISDRTAEQIRLLLNEEQRQRYGQPRQPREVAEDSSKRGLDYWMNPLKAN